MPTACGSYIAVLMVENVLQPNYGSLYQRCVQKRKLKFATYGARMYTSKYRLLCWLVYAPLFIVRSYSNSAVDIVWPNPYPLCAVSVAWLVTTATELVSL